MNASRKSAASTATRSAVAVAVATAIATPAAMAQQVLEEITVTATKREMSVQTVPVAISAVTSAKLRELNITNVLDLGKVVPGLVINNVGNQPVPIIRGAGAAGTSDIAVPIYVDYMYQPLAAQGLAAYTDVDRVEVLRGPQGTLFGRNTLGGLINVIAKKPQFEEFDYGVSLAVGDYDLARLEGFVNVPFSDTVALRVTGTRATRDPYVENTFNPNAGLKDEDNTYARAQLMWAPSDNFDVNLSVNYWDDKANGNADYGYKCLGVPVNATTQQFDGTENGFLDPRCGTRDGWDGGRPQAGNISQGDMAGVVDPDPHRIAFDFAPRRNIEQNGFNAEVNWRFADHHLAFRGSITDFSEDVITDTDLSSNNALVAGHIQDSEVTQLDVTLNSETDGAFQYTIGAYFFDDSGQDANSYAFIWGYTYADPTDPTWATWLYQGQGGTVSTAVYGQAEYSFNDKLTAIAGLRYSQDERESFSFNVDPASLDDRVPSYTGTPDVTKGDDTHTDYKLGLQYDFTDEIMGYATFSTGYIPNGIQEITNALLPAHEVESSELGLKGDYLDGTLRLNAALYHASYENLNTTVFVTIGAAQTIVAQSVPGGSMTSQGLELEGTWFPTDNFTVDFGAAFDDSTFDEFSAANRVGSRVADGGGGFPGSDFIDDNGDGWFILDGEDVRLSPDVTISLGLKYQFEFAGGSSLVPWVYSYYSADYKTTNDPIFWANQDSYTRFDVGATWQSANQMFTIGAYVNNATDETIMTDGTMFSRGRAMADFAPPRNWGVRFSYNY